MDRYRIDGHKLYWHLDRVLEWQKGKSIPPIYVEVSPVGFCNHRCIFCGVDFAMDKGRQLDTDCLCKTLTDMGRLGVRSIMFAGEGEPMLHKDIGLFIRTARESGIDVSLTTNGSKGGYEVWRGILPYLTWVRFSVDAGSSSVHAKVHNVQETLFDNITNSIREAAAVKKDYGLNATIGVQFLIIEENLNDIENAINLFSGMNVDYIIFKPYSLHPQMKNKKDVIYSRGTIDYVQAIVDRYNTKTDTEIIFRKDAITGYMKGEKGFNRCRALPFWGYISSNGDFYTCSVFINDERFKSGNIYNEGMEEILFGKERETSLDYGENVLSIDECRLNCRMARVNEFLEFLENKPQHINFI